MPESPYRPLHDKKKVVTEADMLAILERHKVVPRLTWEKRDDYAIISTCGRFSVAKVLVRDKPTYEAWEGKKALGISDTPEGAKASCEARVRG